MVVGVGEGGIPGLEGLLIAESPSTLPSEAGGQGERGMLRTRG